MGLKISNWYKMDLMDMGKGENDTFENTLMTKRPVNVF